MPSGNRRHLSWNRARSQRVVVRGQMNSKASRFETIEFNIVLQASSKSEACCNAGLHVSKVLGFMIRGNMVLSRDGSAVLLGVL